MNVPPLLRRPRLWIVLCTLAGAGLRFWNVGRLGLQHFDEGIYALAGLWALDPSGPAAIDPGLIPYAPPGYPLLIGLAYRLAFPWPGVSDTAAIVPSLLLGVATIPLVAWLTRRLFGDAAGVAAAAFCALSGPHIAFSRMALTDVAFLVAFLAALGLGMRFLERPGFSRAAALGVAVGLAQNVKYNGWLVGVVVALTAAIGCFDRDLERRRIAVRAIGWGVFAAAVAAAVYAPWFLFVERHGGYSALLRHHRSYVMGVGSWVANWRQQLAQTTALSGLVSGSLTWAGPAWAIAWLGSTLVRGSDADRGRWAGLWDRVLLLGGIALFGMAPNAAWFVAATSAILWIADLRPGVRLLGAAWWTSALITPLYHPYARLWLPLTGLGWIACGYAIAEVLPNGVPDGIQGRLKLPAELKWHAAVVGLLIGIIVRSTVESRAVPYPRLLATNSAEREFVTRRLAPGLNTPPPRGMGVSGVAFLGRPSWLFYLTTSGVPVDRLASWSDVVRRWDADQLLIVDEAVLTGDDRNDPRCVWMINSTYAEPEEPGIVTLLDLDQAAAWGSTRFGSVGFDRVNWSPDALDHRTWPRIRTFALWPQLRSRAGR